MSTLSTELRNKLERTIIQARDVAEAGAKAALEALAVHHYEPFGHMSPEERKLRNHLRARARQLGDKQNRKGELEITHLVWECAYEHWHRMLFARFLAENNILIEPEMGVAVSLEECEELAKEEGKDLWSLASEFAQVMLPQIFRPDNPLLKVAFAREHRLKLEQLLDGLEPSIFTASDSLGWVYQFWQSKRKKEVNQSGNKIGADELPAVTQLFTEPYMVSFLLDNSLGAWWASRRNAGMGRRGDVAKGIFERSETEEEIRKACAIPGVSLEYLRLVRTNNDEENSPDHPFSASPCRTWKPAAGSFKQWPDSLAGFKVLDPCCGSGHFLVSAFLMLVPMRMELEGLSAHEAVDAVLRENLHGLEIDNRCVELAAFALAVAAWGYPDAGGYRFLPELNLACAGLSVNVSKAEWKNVACVLPDKSYIPIALDWLYDEFQNAPVLGSLIDPSRAKVAGLVQWDALIPVLKETLKQEKDAEVYETGIVAHGLAKATQLLSSKYHWVITNVPYLARGKQSEALRDFCDKHYSIAKKDLATVFLNRCLKFCVEKGTSSIVLPQNWLFLTTYKSFRKNLLKRATWNVVAKLGPGAFETISGEVVKAILISISKGFPANKSSHQESNISGIDVSGINMAKGKANGLAKGEISLVNQKKQLKNPDSKIILENLVVGAILSDYAYSYQGIKTGDDGRYRYKFWEVDVSTKTWLPFQGTVKFTCAFGGITDVIDWKDDGVHHARRQGLAAWTKWGASVSQMGQLPCSIYFGTPYDSNVSILVPKKEDHASAIWTFCSSNEYSVAVRKIDQSMAATNAAMAQVHFDLNRWKKLAQEKYPHSLPKPYSDDPTQWIFHGHPAKSEHPLQVTIARLLGYRWPTNDEWEKRRRGETAMELSEESWQWVEKSRELEALADKDGIVCIPSVRGEQSATDRLHNLLACAYSHIADSSHPSFSGSPPLPLSPSFSDWVHQLLNNAEHSEKTLETWLRDHFFEQHCKLFHHRPFIWHIWDGRRRDGFHALVNYHKLAEGNGKGRQLLEKLTYAYLGDWITRQKEGVKRGEGGAEDRLAAALELQKRLIAIIEGEPPFDIFVRWKPIEEQPIGWEPDINDGVRINIRPFMADDIPGGRKGSGILRWKPNIKWNKDRGKDVASAPWFALFKGDRINDHHLSLEEKRAARADAKRGRGEGEKRGMGELANRRRGETGNGGVGESERGGIGESASRRMGEFANRRRGGTGEWVKRGMGEQANWGIGETENG